MKKVLIIFFILAIFLVGFFYVRSNVLPFSVYIIEKLTGLHIKPSSIDVQFKPWTLRIDLNRVGVSGPIMGHINGVTLIVELRKGYWFEYVRFSDFNLAIEWPYKKKLPLSLPPIELLEAINGSLLLENKRILVTSLKLRNLIQGKTFDLVANLAFEPIFSAGSFDVKGIYWESVEDVHGSCEIKNLDLSSISANLQGRTNLKGNFIFKDRKLETIGQISIPYASIRAEFFKEPYAFIEANGPFKFSVFLDTFRLNTSLKNYDGIKIDLSIEFKEKTFNSLRLKTTDMGIEYLKKHVSVEKLAKFDPWKYVLSGKVRIGDLSFRADSPSFYAKIWLSEMSVLYKGFLLEGIESELVINKNEVLLSRTKGRYKSSRIENVTGKIDLRKEKDGRLHGVFYSELSDVSHLLKVENVSVSGGFVKGSFDLSWDKGQEFKIKGKGEIEKGKGYLYGTAVNFEGGFNFSNEGVYFDPLFLSHENTLLKVRGFFKKDNELQLTVQGSFSAGSLASIRSLPLEVEGLSFVNFRLEKHSDKLRIKGEFDFTSLSLFLPQVFKKDGGVKSQVKLNLEKSETEVNVTDFELKLSSLHLKGSGKGNSNNMDFDFSLEIENLEEVAPYFFFDDLSERGHVKAKIAVRDLTFSLEKLPYVKGYVEVEKGFFKLPSLISPVKNLNLRADFEGERMQIKFSGAMLGNSILRCADIKVEGIRNPILTGLVHFEKICTSDFRTRDEKRISIPTLKEMGLPWRTKVFMKVSANEFVHKELSVQGFSTYISKEGPNFSLYNGCAKFLGGQAEFDGTLRLSEPKPRYECEMKIRDIDLAELSSALKREYLLEGKAHILARLRTEGNDLDEMRENLTGEIDARSNKGIIRKWNLIAKILELLNVYQLIKLKFDFTKEGLPYNTMGGSFLLNHGRLNTENFTIDSPSMIIVGNGDIDIYRNRIKGTVSVSPLVAIEKTIEKIPILRNILRGKGKGFITVDYSIKGSLSDPDISVDVVRTVPGKIFEILKNILNLPKDFIRPERGKK